ncbi:Swt1 family HEPN domain-containing protein [Candidatus Viridilinea mediisalina]|uniref:AAA+ family ATPase n=1 Tax=Candidatus Viridilinea mediisalina TaxID=2024553 RepID=A0A2A6RMP2_9CHLR|nr:Swt1 family HEPN domain-containing protein [Candidatus Viridilinea mediisalina]PDW04129.1 AAA+ family ATPase [Candidatus Viridilinea mediisalina]
MATSNHERVGKALELLNAGLRPFFERELQSAYGDTWDETVRGHLSERQGGRSSNWDTTAILGVMIGHWDQVFRRQLGNADRTLIHECRDIRNRWAHQHGFTLDDTYRAFDSIQRLLLAVGAPDQAKEIDRKKQEVLRARFDEQVKREQKRATTAPINAVTAAGLRPWRDVVMPHPDVAGGRYQQAEFAADLGQVYRGEGSLEYRDPHQFFQRTYLTEGLRILLTNALKRLTSHAGDPVVELQTNFGGGKTHSMLALYHLCGGVAPAELAGMDVVLRDTGITHLPTVRRAVLVGTALAAAKRSTKPDGTEVGTLWGEMAYQLLGKRGYALVAEADRAGVNPGSDALRQLFDLAAPCLVLIDEWVAFVRQLYGINGLPAGSFDANLTFAQAMTEAVKAVPHVLIVASLPASDIEIGGEGGREALTRLRNTFARLESSWRPASSEEGFEIVRRRLFQPIADPSLFPQRDAVIRAYGDLYRSNSSEFPADVREADYERRMLAAYPIHPELFDRLFNDWASLDKFQRTRGVLRLMAAVIHSLWERQDRSLLIMPASVPVDNGAVNFELTRYLDDPWVPVIEKDVDGPNSLPLRIDRDNPNLGRYSATRRVARTLYLGSAPTLRAANKGLEDRAIKLGCVQPGETVSVFGDALRRLIGGATHLYENGQRYWFSTQPSVNRLAQDRAEQQREDMIEDEILRRIREELNSHRQNPALRGEFCGVHLAPSSSGDVQDEREVRLVVLGPQHPHISASKQANSAARTQAQQILDLRGSAPRRYKNMLAFLAPDTTRLAELVQATREYLAWRSIEAEAETLNLDAFQRRQSETRCKQADETIKGRIPETYIWLLVPIQGKGSDQKPDPFAPIEWDEMRLQGSDPIILRTSKRMQHNGQLIPKFGGIPLRLELDRIPLWQGDHVAVKQLADYFASYLYLPRLKATDVLLGAISQGLSMLTWETESFAYAERYDEASGRYQGLIYAEGRSIPLDEHGVIVKPAAVQRQIAADEAARRNAEAAQQQHAEGYPTASAPGEPSAEARIGATGYSSSVAAAPNPAVRPRRMRRYYGSARLNTLKVATEASNIAAEILQHLAGLPGAKVHVSLEIAAELPEGAPDHVVRTVTENSRVLKLESYGFEE